MDSWTGRREGEVRGLRRISRRRGTPRGHLVFRDDSANFSMYSTSISSVTMGCQTTLTGVGNSNMGQVQFTVIVTDNGEPGPGKDTFEIHVSGAAFYDNG